jgi:signal transduction histidine kinase
MLRRILTSLRVRLMLLVLAATTPLLLLEIYNALEARRQQAETVSDQVAQLTRLASSSLAQVFEGERQLLVALARLPSVTTGDVAACDAAFADLLAQYQFYANLSAATILGDTYCSAVPQPNGFTAVRDRQFFRRALEARSFAVDDYSLDAITGEPVIAGAYPVIVNGQMLAVVVASLKLEYLHSLTAAAMVPEGAAITIVDSRATILSRYPDPEAWVGESRLDVFDIIAARLGNEPVARAAGLDGVERLYSLDPIAGTGPASLYVSVGVPTHLADAEIWVRLGRNLGVLAIVTLLAIAAAWLGSERLVLAPVRRLLGATKRLAAGDLTARTGAAPGPGELNQLGVAFDAMAAALHQRQSQLQLVNRMLQMLSECNQALVRAPNEPRLLESVTSNIVAHGGYALAWVSLAPPEPGATRLTALSGGTGALRTVLEATGNPNEPAPRLAAEALSAGRAVFFDRGRDVAAGQFDWSPVLEAIGCQAVIALPLNSAGTPNGVLCLGAAENVPVSTEELRLLEELANDLAYGIAALRSSTAREAAEAQIWAGAERSRALAELSRRLAEVTTEVPSVGRATVDCAVAGIGDGAVLELLDVGGDQAEVLAWGHRQPPIAVQIRQQLPSAAAPVEASLARRVLADGHDNQVTSTTDQAQLDRFHASGWLSVPLRAQGALLGALSLLRSAPGPDYTTAEQEFLQAIADRAALAISNVRLTATALHLNAELEQRVAERTAQLAASNRALASENADRLRAEAQVRKLNATLERRAAALETANSELEAFSYSVSHDLRAPLRSIDGFSLALLEDYGSQLDSTAHDYLRRVRAAAQRMAALIDDLLDLSRVARAEMRWEQVDLSALAYAVAADLQQGAPNRRAEFKIAPDLKAQGDGRLLRVMLENLLGNAWKFTSGRDAAVITFGRQETDGRAVYFVRDNGAGFDMAYAHRLFGAFQRLHDQREYPGTGIGLATVQRIIHRHGGRVWADGAVGAGAAFFFVLPDAPPAERGPAPDEERD